MLEREFDEKPTQLIRSLWVGRKNKKATSPCDVGPSAPQRA